MNLRAFSLIAIFSGTTIAPRRSSRRVTPFETSRGTKHVWTTFSDDQVDLDFANPDVLVEMLDVLLGYVHQGGRVIRLGFWCTAGPTLGPSGASTPRLCPAGTVWSR